MKSEERLRALLLLSYADLSAVGPNVWNEWKGALLIKLYLRAERILQGRDEGVRDVPYWTWAKAEKVRELTPAPQHDKVEPFLRDMGERYFASFSPEHIAMHMACLEEARATGLGVHLGVHPSVQQSEIVVCTPDRPGLFADLAGCLAGKLMNVQSASIFTSPDGYAIDCFVVTDAVNVRIITPAEFDALCALIRKVVLDREDVQPYVEQARRRIFGLLRPRVPIRPRVSFDNNVSRTFTVVDIEAGDRTGLLYDIAKVFTEHNIEIQSSRIVTDARRVKDAFYISQNNSKIEDTALLEKLQEELLHATGAVPLL
jgi:[protein-PII] uridylyltransferase